MLCSRRHQIGALLVDAIGAIEPDAQGFDAVRGEPQGDQDADGQEPALARVEHLADRRRQRSGDVVGHQVEHLR